MATEQDVDALFEPDAPADDVDAMFEPDAPAAPKPLTLAEGGGVLSGKPPAPVAGAPTKPSGLTKVLDAAERAVTNTLEGATFGGAGTVVPYINAAVDEINPFSESKDFSDRVAEQRAQYNSKLDPALTAAASVAPSMAMGPLSLGKDAVLNTFLTANNADRQGKDLSNPDNLVDVAQTSALMTGAPHVIGEAVRTAQPALQAVKNSGFADWVRKGANAMASRAVGLNKAQLNNLPVDAPQTIGKILNDKGIMAAGDSAETLAPKIKAAREASGAEMGDVLRTADAATGGSGSQIREISGNRKARDAHEVVKDALRRKALEARVGANASMGRAKLEALEAAAQKNIDTRLANHDVMSKDHLAQVQDLVGGAADDVSRAAERRSDVATAVKNDALFDAGKLDERHAAQAGAAQDFAQAVRDATAKLNDYTPVRDGALDYIALQEMKTRAGMPGMVPDRLPDTSAVVPPPDAMGDPNSLWALPPKARPEAAERLANEVASSKVPVPALADEVRLRADKAPDAPPQLLPPPPDAAQKTAKRQFGSVDPARPETFAAAGPDAKKLEKIYVGDAAEATARPPTDPKTFAEGLGFDAHQFIDRAERELLPALSYPGLEGAKAKAEKLLKAYRSRANNGMSFSEGNKMKSVLQSTIRKFQDAPADQRVKLDLQRMIDDALEEQLAPVVGDENFRKFVKGKAEYGALANANKANNQLIRKEAGNMPHGLMETLGGLGGGGAVGGVAGALTGDPTTGALIGALAGPPLYRQARVRGPASAAKSMDGMARLIESLPDLTGKSAKEIGDKLQGGTLARAVGPERINAFIEWLRAQENKK